MSKSSLPDSVAAADALATVRRYYPDAVTTDDAVHRVLDCFATGCGLTPERILLADSICSDDVNAFEYPAGASAMLGPFRLGGLNGFPHAGLTGMAAFAAHVPEGGGILIYHAPHVGISRDGAYGTIRRPGQQEASGCCGAARAALAKLTAGVLTPMSQSDSLSDLDYQQHTIETIVLSSSNRIQSATLPLMAATDVMYEAIATRIDLLVDRTKFPARWLMRFGGILVNGDADMGSYSVARRVLLTDLISGVTTDLKSELFGSSVVA